MRCFLALDLPDDLSDALAALQDRLHTGRDVPIEDMHVTLAFMADAAPDALEDLYLGLDMSAPPRLSLHVAGIDMFGTDPPRSIHACVRGAGLDDCHRKLSTMVRFAGIALPRRRFVPHVTLARFANRMHPDDMARVGRFLSAHGDWSWPTFVPPALSLYQSTLTPEGPRYDLWGRWTCLPAP